jgi:hypothetical protein
MNVIFSADQISRKIEGLNPRKIGEFFLGYIEGAAGRAVDESVDIARKYGFEVGAQDYHNAELEDIN